MPPAPVAAIMAGMDLTLVATVRAGAAVSWGNAWLQGLASPDDAAARITVDDAAHLLDGAPQEPDPVSWPVGLGRLRAAGTTHLQLALPAPGDPLGLAGPVELNARALAAGAAVLAVGTECTYALLPHPTEDGVTWAVSRANPPPHPPTPTEAARELNAALRGSTRSLEQLAVARHQPGTSAVVADAERLLGDRPPAYPPPRAAELLATGLRLLAVLDHALRGEGAAVSAAEAAARAAALRPVAAAARQALVAAYSAPPELRNG